MMSYNVIFARATNQNLFLGLRNLDTKNSCFLLDMHNSSAIYHDQLALAGVNCVKILHIKLNARFLAWS